MPKGRSIGPSSTIVSTMRYSSPRSSRIGKEASISGWIRIHRIANAGDRAVPIAARPVIVAITVGLRSANRRSSSSASQEPVASIASTDASSVVIA